MLGYTGLTAVLLAAALVASGILISLVYGGARSATPAAGPE
jgi:hypothetical protein